MRRFVAGVHGVDGRGMGSVFELDIHRDDAVAVGDVLVGSVVGSGLGVGHVVVIGLDDLVPTRVPIVAVAAFFLGDGELAFLDVVDAKIEGDDAVAAVLCLKGVSIHAFSVQVLSEERVGSAFTDGQVHFGGLVRVYHDGHVDVLADDAVGDVARIGGGSHGR